MSRQLTLILPFAVGACLATAAAAQMPPPTDHMDPAAHFAAMDTNKDGLIDKTEAAGPLLKRFDAVDTNKDGKLSPDELKAAWKDRMGHMRHEMKRFRHGRHDQMGHGGEHMAMLDSNADGKISLDEMIAPLKAHFDKLDTNHDGFIDANEMPKKPMKHKDHHHDDEAPATVGTPPKP